MKEQKRAASSKSKGKKSINQKKWPTVVSHAKASRAEQTSGKRQSAIDKKRQELNQQLSDLRLPEVIHPKFSLTTEHSRVHNLLTIRHANIGYANDKKVLEDVNLSVGGQERIAICGKNGSGKSTLLKALLGYGDVVTTGDWHLPPSDNVGYLDQHYSTLKPKLLVLEHIMALRPDWSYETVRRHLSDFLFRENEAVMQRAVNLSGGEKARASLSMIAAKTPKLLVLDEVTNNLDLETKMHVIQVLKAYPGALIVVSHEMDFLNAIDIDCFYSINKHALKPDE